MEINCQNCNQIVATNFCGYCGQKKYKRIDKQYIWDEVQYTTIHANKGLLYSLKNIIRNPGKTARKFVEGNRVNHYKPILLVFVLSGFSAFLSFKVIGIKEIMEKATAAQNVGSKFMDDYLVVMGSYYSFIMLLTVPFLAIFSKIAFRKWGHNYYEHVVMNAIGLSFYTSTYIILFYPIIYSLKGNATLLLQFSQYSTIVIPFMMVWFYKGFYPEKSLKSIIVRVLLVVVFSIIVFLTLMIAIMIIYTIMIGPKEAMEYFSPKKL